MLTQLAKKAAHHAVNRLSFARLTYFLRRRGYRIAGTLKKGKVFKLLKGSRWYLYKKTTPGGITIIRDVLPQISTGFRRIVVPDYVDGGCRDNGDSWIIMTWLDGRDFNDRWDEINPSTAGGRAIGCESIAWILEMIAELRNVPVATLEGLPVSRLTRDVLTARLDKWTTEAAHRGWLTHKELRLAASILEPFLDTLDAGDAMLTNGDFQFRNFLEISPDRTGIVDWDAARVSTFELEHCIAYQWLLMWHNVAWQQQFLQEAKARFSLRPHRLQCAMLINALLRAATWRNTVAVRDVHLQYFKQIQSDSGFARIWNGLTSDRMPRC